MKPAQAAPLPGAPDPWAPSEMPRFRARPPYAMTEMIAVEPAVAERLVRRLARDEPMAALEEAVRAAHAADQPILLTGCGSSEHAALGVAAMLGEALGGDLARRPRAVPALEATRLPPAAGVLVAISHEGGTTVTNEAIHAARAAGAQTALITVGDGSPGARIARIVVRTEEQDQSWCHTIGYLAPLTVGAVLAARLRGARPDAVAIRSAIDGASDTRAAAGMAAALAGCDRLLVAGTGADHISARELALKIEEGARLPATAHELETVLHGHLAAATRWTGLIVIQADPVAATGLAAERAGRLRRAAADLGVPTAGIVAHDLDGDVPGAETPAGRLVLPRGSRVVGLAGPLLEGAIALQLLTERLARARHVDPDTLGREDAAQAAAHG